MLPQEMLLLREAAKEFNLECLVLWQSNERETKCLGKSVKHNLPISDGTCILVSYKGLQIYDYILL